MQLRKSDTGEVVMALAPEQGPGIDLALTASLLHSLTELISNAARIADWALSSPIGDGPLTAVPDNVTVN